MNGHILVAGIAGVKRAYVNNKKELLVIDKAMEETPTSAVGEIEESGGTLVTILSSEVVFARAGITKRKTDLI